MDIKFWFWIIIVLGSFIVNAIKKSRAARPSAGSGPQPTPGKRQLSFEELLEEIQSQKKASRAPAKEVTVDLPPVRNVQPVEYNYERTNEIYEKAKQEAFNRPSLEETMKLSDTVVAYGAFRNYAKPVGTSRAAAFANEIRNPSGFRKAFIMSEILQRKF